MTIPTAQRLVKQSKLELETWDKWPDDSIRTKPRSYYEERFKQALENLHRLQQKQAKVIQLYEIK